MMKPRELTSLALLAPRVARSATVSIACARIVDDLARTMKLQCAIVETSGQSRAIVCSSPRELQMPEDPAAATQIPLGAAGGVDRVLLIVRRDGDQIPDQAWLEILQSTLSDALTLVAMRADAERRKRADLRCYRFAAELLRPRAREHLYRFIGERMAQAVGARTGSLALYDSSPRMLWQSSPRTAIRPCWWVTCASSPEKGCWGACSRPGAPNAPGSLRPIPSVSDDIAATRTWRFR